MDEKNYSDIIEEFEGSDALKDELLSVDKKDKKIKHFGMKKTIILASVAVVLIAALIAGVMIFTGKENDEKTVKVLYDYEDEDIKRIEVQNFLKQDDYVLLPFMNGTELEWNIEGQKYDNVNQLVVKNLVQYSSHLESRYVVEYDEALLGEYGLNEPVATVTIDYKDNNSVTIDIGNIFGLDEGAYVRLHGDEEYIYVVVDYARIYFTSALSDLMNLPSLSRTTLSANAVSFINKERAITTLAYVPDPIYGTEAWYLIEPTDSETNSTEVDTLFDNINTLALSSFYANKVGEDISVYGFDKPECEFQSYDIEGNLLDHFIVGKLAEGLTDTYYCVLLGADEEITTAPVYLVKKDQVALININPVKLANPYLLALNINWLRSGSITVDGVEYKITVERQLRYDDEGEVLYNDDGSENTKNTYYINGIKLDELQFKHFYSKFLFLYIEGIAPQNAVQGEILCEYALDVVIPVQDTETGKYNMREITYAGTYYKISENYAVLDSNQSANAVFTVRIRSIDAVKEALMLLLDGRMPTD